MTALFIITLLLTAAFVTLTALSRRLSGKASFAANVAAAGAGCVALLILVIVFGAINTSADAALAESNFRFFLKISLIFEGVFLFLTLVPALMLFVEEKPSGYSEFLRKVFPTLSSAILLLMGLLAYLLTRHITSYLGIFIYFIGVSEALIMRLPYAVADIKRLLTERKKSVKNNSRGKSRRKGKS